VEPHKEAPKKGRQTQLRRYPPPIGGAAGKTDARDKGRQPREQARPVGPERHNHRSTKRHHQPLHINGSIRRHRLGYHRLPAIDQNRVTVGSPVEIPFVELTVRKMRIRTLPNRSHRNSMAIPVGSCRRTPIAAMPSPKRFRTDARQLNAKHPTKPVAQQKYRGEVVNEFHGDSASTKSWNRAQSRRRKGIGSPHKDPVRSHRLNLYEILTPHETFRRHPCFVPPARLATQAKPR